MVLVWLFVLRGEFYLQYRSPLLSFVPVRSLLLSLRPSFEICIPSFFFSYSPPRSPLLHRRPIRCGMQGLDPDLPISPAIRRRNSCRWVCMAREQQLFPVHASLISSILDAMHHMHICLFSFRSLVRPTGVGRPDRRSGWQKESPALHPFDVPEGFSTSGTGIAIGGLDHRRETLRDGVQSRVIVGLVRSRRAS